MTALGDVLEVRLPVTTLWAEPQAGVTDEPGRLGGNDERVLSQLLMGESVRVVEERGSWLHVVALLQPSGQASDERRHGYPGWVRREALGRPVGRNGGAIAYVITPSASCRTDDGLVQLSFGTALWVAAVGEGGCQVLLPGDHTAGPTQAAPRVGTLTWRDVRLDHKRQTPVYGPDDVLDTARQLLGLRYAWGGLTSSGIDCSGLVHVTLRAYGVVLPRDAGDQQVSRQVVPVPLDAAQPGDLYFFALPDAPVTHVGFASSPPLRDGTRWMLHACGDHGVEEKPMSPQRLAQLVSAGRVVKPETGQFARHPERA